MQQIQVEPVRCEALETALAGGDRAFRAGVVRIDLADEKNAIALSGDGFAHQLFSAAVTVHLGGVDNVHAKLDTQAQRCHFGIVVASALAHSPRAESKRRNANAVGH